MILIGASDLEDLIEQLLVRVITRQTHAEPRPAPRADEEEPLAYRTREAAQKLGVCEVTLRKLRDDEGIPSFKVDGVCLFPADGLRDWLAQRAAQKTSAATPQSHNERS